MRSAQLRPVVSMFFVVGLFSLLFTGCTGSQMLMDKDQLSAIPYTTSSDHHIISYNETFTYTPDGRLFRKQYRVVRLGRNAGAFPAYLHVFDGAIHRLLEFEGRVTHLNGPTEKFSKGDLSNYNISNSRVIANNYFKYVELQEKLNPGDLIETVSLHELTLAPLGVDFSLRELEYPAENITCTIETPLTDSLEYRIVNDSVACALHLTPAGRSYTFSWKSYTPPPVKNAAMLKRNRVPELYAALAPQTWNSFGDWYLYRVWKKLQPGTEIARLTQNIVAGKSTPKEKMDAIFEYCQHNIRYEQVYLEYGEFVPNEVETILAHKYGDCKDYASLMYAMAKSAGIDAHLVLCYRGRGVEFFDDIPVSQFNHCILHLNDGGRDYWYDGTNRAGLPGITTFDLANARALVMEKDHSKLVTIEESPENDFTITGTLQTTGEGNLSGDLTLTFSKQYAIDFFWLANQLNTEKMTETLTQTLKDKLNENIIVHTLAWKTGGEMFTITASCELPNCVTTLQPYSYVSIAHVLPGLLPDEVGDVQRHDAYYFPFYNRVSVDLALTNCTAAGANTGSPARLQMRYQLPAGPLNETTRAGFLAQLDSTITTFNKPYKLTSISQ